MMSISKPFEESGLQNVTQLLKNSNLNSQSLVGDIRRPAPVLPPRPYSSSGGFNNSFPSYGGKNVLLITLLHFSLYVKVII